MPRMSGGGGIKVFERREVTAYTNELEFSNSFPAGWALIGFEYLIDLNAAVQLAYRVQDSGVWDTSTNYENKSSTGYFNYGQIAYVNWPTSWPTLNKKALIQGVIDNSGVNGDSAQVQMHVLGRDSTSSDKWGCVASTFLRSQTYIDNLRVYDYAAGNNLRGHLAAWGIAKL